MSHNLATSEELDNPELSTDGKDMPLFWEQNKQCFSSVSGNARSHSHPPSLFLNPSHLSANTPPYLLIYTDADLNTCTHTHALVADVVSAKYLCQFLPASLRSLSLASYNGEQLGNLLDSDSVDLFLSWFVLFHFEDDCSMLQLLLALCL